jgi:hypothetical protein
VDNKLPSSTNFKKFRKKRRWTNIYADIKSTTSDNQFGERITAPKKKAGLVVKLSFVLRIKFCGGRQFCTS